MFSAATFGIIPAIQMHMFSLVVLPQGNSHILNLSNVWH